MTMREAVEEARGIVSSCRNGRIAWPLRFRVTNLLDKAICSAEAESNRLNTELAALKAEKAGSVSVPLDQWRRLAELVESQTLASENGGHLTTLASVELHDIIAAVEVQHE